MIPIYTRYKDLSSEKKKKEKKYNNQLKFSSNKRSQSYAPKFVVKDLKDNENDVNTYILQRSVLRQKKGKEKRKKIKHNQPKFSSVINGASGKVAWKIAGKLLAKNRNQSMKSIKDNNNVRVDNIGST